MQKHELAEILKRATDYQWDSIKWMIATDRCQRVLFYRLRKRLTQAEAARKLGVTPERIRQIYEKGLRGVLLQINRFKEMGKYDFILNPKPVLPITEEPIAVKLDLPLQYVDLPERVRNCFICTGKKTIRDVVSMSEAELMAIRCFGIKSLAILKERLDYLGLKLRN